MNYVITNDKVKSEVPRFDIGALGTFPLTMESIHSGEGIKPELQGGCQADLSWLSKPFKHNLDCLSELVSFILRIRNIEKRFSSFFLS